MIKQLLILTPLKLSPCTVFEVITPQKYAELTIKIKKWRKEKCTEQNTKAWCVMPDLSMDDLIHKRPANVHELCMVFGMGKQKLLKYGVEVTRHKSLFCFFFYRIKNFRTKSGMRFGGWIFPVNIPP